jgi:glycosyltransferase involved in cell wall biosynthesis
MSPSRSLRSRPHLEYVRIGGFSGCALSLLRALESRVEVKDWDLSPLPRRPSLLPARLAAVAEARMSGPGVPWTRTASWARSVQRFLDRRGALDPDGVTLFVQSLPACVPDPRLRYGIYTDRVTLEGAAAERAFRSRFTPGWLDRERRFLRGASRIYLMGPSTAEVLEKEYGVLPSRIRVVGAGPNVPVDGIAGPETLKTLIFVGKEWDRKGGPELVKAFTAVRGEFPSLELLVVGSSPTGPIPPGVRVIGSVSHGSMGSLYGRAGALVIPTHAEPFGIAVLEALMRGLPCIGTDVGNQRWIIGEGGICVPPGDVGALARAIRQMVLDYAAYRERARRRGSKLRQEFSWDRVASVIVEELVEAGSVSPKGPE